jgi:hypothetical protein
MQYAPRHAKQTLDILQRLLPHVAPRQEYQDWSSVVGAYYRQTGESYYVYSRNVITQDATDGWRDNRAPESCG